MGRTAFVLLVDGADVIHIFLFACRNGLANHTCTAISAENHSAEQTDRFAAGTATSIAFQHLLNTVKVDFGNDCFVAVLYDRPVTFILGNALVYLR